MSNQNRKLNQLISQIDECKHILADTIKERDEMILFQIKSKEDMLSLDTHFERELSVCADQVEKGNILQLKELHDEMKVKSLEIIKMQLAGMNDIVQKMEVSLNYMKEKKSYMMRS